MCVKEQNCKLIEKPSTSNTVKSISKIKDRPTSNNEISSISLNLDHILRSGQFGHNNMPKEYTHQYDSKKTEHSRLRKGNSKQSPKAQNSGLLQSIIFEWSHQEEETLITKGSIRSFEFEDRSTSCFHESAPVINEAMSIKSLEVREFI